MANEPNVQPEHQPVTGDRGYERRDARAMVLFLIAGGLMLAVVCCQIGVHFALRAYARKPMPSDRFTGARREVSPGASAPQIPRLQLSPPEDLRAFRAREAEEMETYGWINRTAGVLRIPVDRAMDLILQRGLPVRTAGTPGRVGPTPMELQQERTNSTQAETVITE